MTFDVLVPEGRKGRVDETLFRTATQAAKEFATEPSGWLAFQGSTGSGKTHLAAAIVNSIIDRGSPAKYISALEVPDLLRNERFEENESAEGGSFPSLLNAPVLVIDDLGAQQATNWVDSKIDQLLTHRFNGRMPTVIVLAKSIDEMPERIAMKVDDPSLSRVEQLTSGNAASNNRRVNIPKAMLERMTFDTFDPTALRPRNLMNALLLALRCRRLVISLKLPENGCTFTDRPALERPTSPSPLQMHEHDKARRLLSGLCPIS